MDPHYSQSRPPKRQKVSPDSDDAMVDEPSTSMGNLVGKGEDGEKSAILAAAVAGGIDANEVVCFGVLGDILGKCQKPASNDAISTMEASLVDTRSFTLKCDRSTKGHIDSDHTFTLHDILQSEIGLHVACVFQNDTLSREKKTGKAGLSSCKLEIALYGPFAMIDEVKQWSGENEIYLQDPRYCLKDAMYCNPQRLSLSRGSPCMVSEIVPRVSEHRLRLRNITDDDDFLDKYLSSKAELEEAEQPSLVKTALQRHQKQALTFMLRRETGWAFNGPEVDMWSIVDNANGRFYVNAVSERGSEEPPPPLYGGIIADPMGLGKTLTMIALVATDKSMAHRQDQMLQQAEKTAIINEGMDAVSATLIVVPPPLLRVWEKQIQEHVFTGAMKYKVHHGKSKVTCFESIQAVDVVITTYHTVSGEWKADKSSSSMLFSVKWKRIVLDEAHMIRNETSKMSRAMCALDSTCRWAVTATPIQNHLNDLAALLKFIRAYPYNGKSHFERDISEYWKEGRAEEAASRLQRLSSCLFLRRPKSTIKLPARVDNEYPVEFTIAEREEYENLKNRAASVIDDALQQGHGSHRSGAYANILQHIETLRLFCGLGLHYHSRYIEGSLASHSGVSWDTIAQQTFKMHLEMGSEQCSQCHTIIDLTQSLLEDSVAGKLLFSRCLTISCSDCSSKLLKRGLEMPCGHNPACPAAEVSTSADAMDSVDHDREASMKGPTQLPSKVMALISDILRQPVGIKSVVFSSWRLTLNIVAAGLDQYGIKYLRFDGRVPQKERQKILDSFKGDPSIRVMLLTLSCGAVGLTLTEASRAYLMEPHWNPTIEEQALGRIHRIGQDKEVTTIRLFVRDSFETHVMNVQQSKKDLARVILSPHDGGGSNTTVEKLQSLRSLL